MFFSHFSPSFRRRERREIVGKDRVSKLRNAKEFFQKFERSDKGNITPKS